ncbi:MAG: hypothetical protein ACJZ59_05500 [Candidatus Thalassarchaeaceae archaeon]
MSEEFALAPGLAWALGQVEDDSSAGGPRRRGPESAPCIEGMGPERCTHPSRTHDHQWGNHII